MNASAPKSQARSPGAGSGSTTLSLHSDSIEQNRRRWADKPLLRRVYRDFHERIAAQINLAVPGLIVELGSGIAAIKEIIPNCVTTDLFANADIDRVESAYRLSFGDGEVSHLILFDVFHHLEFLRTALREFLRVLAPGGRVIILDPYISVSGRLVYGLLHPEPIAFNAPLQICAPEPFDAGRHQYYAAQGNATRIFWRGEYPELLNGWKMLKRERNSSWAYVLSGGYSKPQVYPGSCYPLLKKLDAALDMLPGLFALRTLVVLEKPVL